ncbi:MAG: Dicamba O-demethylase 1, ferredoxin reductase component [Hyphomicrobiaceae bacterium hypho_1]
MYGDPIIIVGAGQCGVKSIETIRRLGFRQEIILIGDENYLPYHRPPLSKGFLKGDVNQESLFITNQSFFDERNVKTIFGTRAVYIDSDKHIIGLKNGQQLSYSKLLLALGSRPRNLEIPGINLKGICSIRTIDDVKSFLGSLKIGNLRIVIIGGGYTGLEVASSMRICGHQVTLIESKESVLKRVVCQQVSDFFESLHERHGVSILKKIVPKQFLGEKSVSAIELSNGKVIECDIVVVCIGNIPEVELAVSAGIEIDNGIKVDPTCQTSAEDIYAAGDCASFLSQRYGRVIRLESVQNAVDQGKAAAQAILGETMHYDPIPWFWSDQYNTRLQIAGISDDYDYFETERGKRAQSFSVTYFKKGHLICVESVNDARAYLKGRRTLEEASTC